MTALLTKTLIHAYLIFFFLGIGQGGFWTSAMSLIYEFAGEKDKKVYFALTDSLTAPFVLFFTVLSGVLIPQIGTELVLVLLGVFLVIGILSLAFFTREPKTVHIDVPPPAAI